MAAEKLVIIVGPTASGKSGIALQLAQEHGGEIICADSRTIYKGMDIGTAKPTAVEQALVPHHLLDIVTPDQTFTAAQFQQRANQAITDIHERGKLPIMVGGTGLYVDSVIYNYSFRSTNPALRQQLEKLTVAELQERILALGLELPENKQNPRHLIRILETNGQVAQNQTLRPATLLLGVDCPTDVLKARIAARVEAMVAQGLEAEVEALAAQYGWEAEAMKGIGYREWQAYFEGPRNSEDLIKTKELIIKNTWQYARRQRTWFKRNKNIHWDSPVEQPSATIEG